MKFNMEVLNGSVDQIMSNFNANIDMAKFFMVDQNGLTPFGAYTFGNIAKEWFKQQMEQLDADGLFVKRQVVEGIPNEIKEKFKSIYKQIFAQKLEAEKQFRDKLHVQHPEWFRNQVSLPSSNVIKTAALAILAKESEQITINDAVQGYKASNELLKSIPNDALTPYCVETKIMLNMEHRDEWNAEMKAFKLDAMLPSFEEWLDRLNYPTGDITNSRISLNRAKCEDWSVLHKTIELMMKAL